MFSNNQAMMSKVKSTFNWGEAKSLLLQFAAGGGAVTLAFSSGLLLEGEWGAFLKGWALNGTIWVAIGWGNGKLFHLLEREMPWLETPVKRLAISLLLTLAYSLGIALLIVLAYAYPIWGQRPSEAIGGVGWPFFISISGITLLVSFFLHGRGFFIAWKNAEVEAEANKRAALAAEYEALKNQVNPHFLFNSFNVLSALVYKDADLSAQFIRQLSQVYRYVLDTSGQELVPLEEELGMLQAYLFLLRIRFGEAIDTRLEVAAQVDEAIVPLALQMLVENAVKHNVAAKGKPLAILISREGGSLIVKNTLQLKTNRQDRVGAGLPNLQRRYAFLAGQQLDIKTEGGFFWARVPILELKPVAALAKDGAL
ncbi:histidine kinase [Phaeodactylibacter luteus]|uniref:Histidine kinase n=2 Tax=Phaeodactylibacter luteus TaxID=1564516 RepID=A0A5C6RMS3_9BACT|nr:histidine kinase [Phaeodactylibacter luteus]